MNGKPGDHPVNDIVDYRLPVYSSEIDEMIRQIATLVPRYRMWEMFDWFNLPPLQKFREQVKTTLDRLRTEARERGWELPEE